MSAPISRSTDCTSAICSGWCGLEASTTCSSRSASTASCRVALKASIRPCGRSRMKPTVSEIDTLRRRVAQVQMPRGGVQRGEQLVGRIGARLHQRVEQRGLAGVGVADQRDVEGVAPLALAPLGAALALHLGEPLARAPDGVADHAAVEFDLRLARAAARADAAALALQVGPAPHQARAEVLQPRQLDLQLALVAARALGEDLEDQEGAVVHRARPSWRSRLRCCAGLSAWSKIDLAGAVQLGQLLDLVGLAAADEQRRIGRLALADQARDRREARGLREQAEFLEFAVEMGQPEIDADENDGTVFPGIQFRQAGSMGKKRGGRAAALRALRQQRRRSRPPRS